MIFAASIEAESSSYEHVPEEHVSREHATLNSSTNRNVSGHGNLGIALR